MNHRKDKYGNNLSISFQVRGLRQVRKALSSGTAHRPTLEGHPKRTGNPSLPNRQKSCPLVCTFLKFETPLRRGAFYKGM